MSSNRQRNIFTLAMPQKAKEIHPADPFERDPFKINSYNFRYADRPSFQLPTLQQRTTNHQHNEYLKDCQTFFYNYNFPKTSKPNAAKGLNLLNDKENQNLTKYQEYRRRKFLNETNSYRNRDPTETKENLLNLNQNFYSSNILNSHNENANENVRISQTSLKQHNLMPTAKRLPFINNNTHNNNCTQQNSILSDRICSLGSGCEISIDIKSLKNNSLHENVNIKIKTDSKCKNLNIPLTNSKTKARAQQLNSADTFVIDKSLSNQDMPGKDHVKRLTCIYSWQKLSKSPNQGPIKSNVERLPSLIPFKSNESRQNYNSMMSKDHFANRKSLLQRVKTNLSVYDVKAPEKSCSHNNLSRHNYNVDYGKIKGSSCSLKKLSKPNQPSKVSAKHCLRSLAKSIDSVPLRLNANARVPLNVNINVFTDRSKLWKV